MSLRAHRLQLLTLTLVLAASSAASHAHAHFTLMEPACYSEQDILGSPQKSGPCGQEDPGAPAVPTDAVTTLIEGGMLTLTIDETIFHPGHYRIAIAPDMASLPADPPVTPGSTPCGSTIIDPAPALPLLADGVFVHTARFDAPQTIEIPLPAGFTCDHCVVQVLEFMSNHPLNDPGGCFYHHCADVTVTAADTDAGMSVDDAAMSVDAGTSSVDAGTSRMDSGPTTVVTPASCACSAARIPASRGLGMLALAGLAIFIGRRRQRAR